MEVLFLFSCSSFYVLLGIESVDGATLDCERQSDCNINILSFSLLATFRRAKLVTTSFTQSVYSRAPSLDIFWISFPNWVRIVLYYLLCRASENAFCSRPWDMEMGLWLSTCHWLFGLAVDFFGFKNEMIYSKYNFELKYSFIPIPVHALHRVYSCAWLYNSYH